LSRRRDESPKSRLIRRLSSPFAPEARYSPRIAQAVSDPEVVDEDTRFLCEQAQRYLSARPWDRLGSQAIYMMLKVGSWYQACAQAFTSDSSNVLFLIPGWRNLRDLQKAGFTGPPPGTVFAELHEADPTFQLIESEGRLPVDRFSGQMLALALAAMVELNAADPSPETEIRGDLRLPGDVRGRYRAVQAPADPDADRAVPMMSVLRHDLYADGDCTVSFMHIRWDEYRALCGRAQLRVPSPEPFEDQGESIPVIVLSASIKEAWSIADKLHTARPLGIAFGETEDGLSVMVAGPNAGYVLMSTQEEASGVLAWWHSGTDSSGGASALMVVDTTPDQSSLDRWLPTHVLAVFEFGRQHPS
jgi:hypothetical protein